MIFTPKYRPEDVLAVLYRNWEGKTSLRHIVPMGAPYFGSNQWHTTPTWLMEVWDHDKSTVRTFALDGLLGAPAPTTTPFATSSPAHDPLASGPDSKEAKKRCDLLHHEADAAIWDAGLRPSGSKKVHLNPFEPSLLRMTVTRLAYGRNFLRDEWGLDDDAKVLCEQWLSKGGRVLLDLYCPVLKDVLQLPYEPGPLPPAPFRLERRSNLFGSPYWGLVPLTRSAERMQRIRNATATSPSTPPAPEDEP